MMKTGNSLKIVSVVGARPNFMKIAPFAHAIARHNQSVQKSPDPQHPHRNRPIRHFLVHTGQHYDKAMSHAFFDALQIPRPDVDLGVGSGTHAEQVGRTMIELEKVLLDQKPDWVVVVGDVNATAAGSITAKKCHVQVAHIEAGLRSRDLRMPEEINRMVTDSITDLLLTPDEMSSENLRREGHAEQKIRFVGNIMIDTLEANRDKAAALDLNAIVRDHAVVQGPASGVSLKKGGFCVLTMHRPSNVDDPQVLEPLVRLLVDEVAAELPLVWSLHPRTRKNLEQFGLWQDLTGAPGVFLISPVGYHEMLHLNINARMVLTDSGGLQEECCVLGTPCITMRENTERPVTLVEHGGVSILTGPDPERIRTAFRKIVSSDLSGRSYTPPCWDGKTASRIVNELLDASTR